MNSLPASVFLQVDLTKEVLSPLISNGILGAIIAILFIAVFLLFKYIMQLVQDFKTITKENGETMNKIVDRNNDVIAKNTEMFISVKTILERK